ncbi:hypothetical protein Moror_16830 [Moniliophthora roreri MCA 2997]|uniref:Transmembrane protein n=1 Tax=Moniliophthora roreri (strain MCA 2997) TaxID=1381753 RepID=V2WSE5_MONRO|nr:hypothetical protein Moror_16830 [Moniliophthora roreri MCA 2997]
MRTDKSTKDTEIYNTRLARSDVAFCVLNRFNNHDIRILLLPFPSLSRHQPGLSKQSANSVMLDFTPAQYHYLQILIGLTHVISLSLLSFLIPRQAPRLYQWKRLTWGKVCLFLFLVDCWLFIFFSGLLLTGIGTRNSTLCAVTIWSCLFFQGSVKTLKYAFLVEKSYIVWSGGRRISRFRTKVYRMSSAVLLGHIVFSPFLVKNNHVREDRICVIVFSHPVLFSMGAADLSLYVAFTWLFLLPLRRTHIFSPRLRDVARKTLYGTVVALTISAGNVVAVAVLAGIEMAQVCMISCVLDVTLNALVLYRVSSGASSYSVNHPTIPEINVTKSSTAVKTRWSPMNKIDQVGTVNTYRDGAIERRHSV